MNEVAPQSLFGRGRTVSHFSERDYLDHLQLNQRPFSDAYFLKDPLPFAQSISVRVGGLVIAGGRGSPVHLVSRSDPQQTILIPIAGRGVIQEGDREFKFVPGTIIRSSYHKPLTFDYDSYCGVTVRPDLEILATKLSQRLDISIDQARERLLGSGTRLADGNHGGIHYHHIFSKLLQMVGSANWDQVQLEQTGFEDLFSNVFAEFVIDQEGWRRKGR